MNKFLLLLSPAFGLTAALAQHDPEPEAVAFCSELREQPNWEDFAACTDPTGNAREPT